MTTNTRRKTFNTPLEFWQWAIMEPGKRKARARMGEVFYVHEFTKTGAVAVFQVGQHFSPALGSDSGFPLVAVEDEHGAIEEEKPKFRIDLESIKVDPRMRDYFNSVAEEVVRYRAAELEGILEDKIRKLIREEIAAATVRWDNKSGEWGVTAAGSLKPKGESK